MSVCTACAIKSDGDAVACVHRAVLFEGTPEELLHYLEDNDLAADTAGVPQWWKWHVVLTAQEGT